jgi:hypothetical protein
MQDEWKQAFAQTSFCDDFHLAGSTSSSSESHHRMHNAAVEDDIRRDLTKIGFTMEARKWSKEDINMARQRGDFHFSTTETWGTPYDPHSYASGWIDGKGGGGVYLAMASSSAPFTREELFDLAQDAGQDPQLLPRPSDHSPLVG